MWMLNPVLYSKNCSRCCSRNHHTCDQAACFHPHTHILAHSYAAPRWDSIVLTQIFALRPAEQVHLIMHSAVFGLISDFAVFQGFKCRAGESEEVFSPSSAMVCLRSATSCQRLCLPVGPQCGLSSASRRKSACQLGRFHLIKLTPFAPVCLSVPPSQ